jgi:hypothetical protein
MAAGLSIITLLTIFLSGLLAYAVATKRTR